MKAYWVACDHWFLEAFPSFCSKTVRRPVLQSTGKGTFVATSHEHLLTPSGNGQAQPVELIASQHVNYVCNGRCGNRPGCMFCDGGLSACVRCGSFEGATTTECPGEKVPEEKFDAVYAGRLDFVGNQWVHGACSRSSPRWHSSAAGKAELERYYKLRNIAASKGEKSGDATKR